MDIWSSAGLSSKSQVVRYCHILSDVKSHHKMLSSKERSFYSFLSSCQKVLLCVATCHHMLSYIWMLSHWADLSSRNRSCSACLSSDVLLSASSPPDPTWEWVALPIAPSDIQNMRDDNDDDENYVGGWWCINKLALLEAMLVRNYDGITV